MYRLSTIVSETYNKYQKSSSDRKIEFNLDLFDQSGVTDQPEKIKAELEKHLKSAIDRSARQKISLTLKDSKIILKDNGTILSKPLCRLLSQGHVTVESRVGFGTTVTIDPNSTK